MERFFSHPRWQENPRAWRDRFVAEVRDDQWADASELKFGDFIARHPHAHAYENVEVECRQTLCQFYAEVDKSMASAVQSGPYRNMDPTMSLRDEALGNELEQVSVAFSSAERDHIAMVITLKRKQAD